MSKTQIMLALSIAAITSLLFIPTDTISDSEMKKASSKHNSVDNQKLTNKANSNNDHSAHLNSSQKPKRIQLNKNHSGSGLSNADIIRLGELFKTEEDPTTRRQIFDELIAGITAENALEMRKYIEHLSDKSKEFKDFHRAFGAVAGLVAVEHGNETKKIDLAVTFEGWATADKDAALEWFHSLEVKTKNAMNQSFLAMAVLEGLAVNNPIEAVQFLEGLDFKTNKAKAAKIIGKAVWQNAVYDGNFDAAMTWTESLEDPILKSYSQPSHKTV